jgi:tetratricopeptide (TPR) repeat protein
MAGSLQEGIRFYSIRRWELALQELLKVNTEHFDTEKNTELAYYLGLCYTKLERYDDALLYLEQVITAAQNPLQVYQCRLTLAYIYVVTKRAKLAEFELNQLAKNGFESVQLYTTQAYAAWSQKHYQKAIEFYEKALDLDESNPTALNGLGFILVDTNQDIPRGLRYCRRAVDRNPQNPADMDSLGWAFFKSGEISEARIWLRRALDMAPDEREIRTHMKVVIGDSQTDSKE